MTFMKPVGTTLGGILAGLAVFLTLTNPGQRTYERYATEKLSTYLKENVCSKAQSSKDFRALLRGSCKTLVDTSRPQIEQIIAVNTTRQNFILFSIYQTELLMPSPVPSYQFGTIGVLHNFFTYQAEKI